MILLTNYYISGLPISICAFKGMIVFCNGPPPMYTFTPWGDNSISIVLVLFHTSIAKSKLHKPCLVVSSTFIQKGHILSTFTPFLHPLTVIALWINNHRKQTKVPTLFCLFSFACYYSLSYSVKLLINMVLRFSL